jgi:hypothetical protein
LADFLPVQHSLNTEHLLRDARGGKFAIWRVRFGRRVVDMSRLKQKMSDRELIGIPVA